MRGRGARLTPTREKLTLGNEAPAPPEQGTGSIINQNKHVQAQPSRLCSMPETDTPS